MHLFTILKIILIFSVLSTYDFRPPDAPKNLGHVCHITDGNHRPHPPVVRTWIRSMFVVPKNPTCVLPSHQICYPSLNLSSAFLLFNSYSRSVPLIASKICYLASLNSRLFIEFMCLFGYLIGFKHLRGRNIH